MRRREFLKSGSLALTLPLLAPRLAWSAEGPTNRNVLVCLFLRGGADGLNMVVPYAEDRYYSTRPTLAIPPPGEPDGVLDLDGFFGLHPGLGALQPLYGAGALAVVHAAGSPDESRSHFDAQDFMETGYPGKGLVFDGWLNRHLQGLPEISEEGVFGAVGLGSTVPLSLRGEVPAMGLNSVEDFDLAVPVARKQALRQALTRFHAGTDPVAVQGRQVFEAIDTLAEVSAGAPSEVDYPPGQFGQQLAGLAALLKADIGVEVACVDLGGWDHHDRETAQLSPLLTQLGEGLAAFYADLGEKTQSVTVVAMTEFGRRVEENASAGTDHGHASLMLALGAGVNGGRVFGSWPGLGVADLNRGDLEVTTDFRSVLGEALIQGRGETDLEAVFPGFSGTTAPGIFRPA